MSKRKLESKQEESQEKRKKEESIDTPLSFVYDGNIEIFDTPLTKDDVKCISYFRDTYNALYVKNLSPQKKRYAINNNRILKRLVENLDSPKDYMVDYIEGPNSFTKFKLEVRGIPKKSFYLFGEKHIPTKNHCSGIQNSITFSEYIKKLSLQSPSFFDLYVELPLLSPVKPLKKGDLSHYDINRYSFSSRSIIIKSMYEMLFNETLNFEDAFKLTLTKLKLSGIIRRIDTDYTITDILTKYYECIQPSTRKTESCELMRIHNIDSRENWDNFISCEQFYMEVLVDMYNPEFNVDVVYIINILKRIGQPILNIFNALLKPDSEAVSTIFELMKTNPFIEKELRNSYLKDLITDFIKSKLTKIMLEWNLRYFNIEFLINCINNGFLEQDHEIIKAYIQRAFIYFEDIGVLSMDLYSLSRIFKDYKKKDDDEGIQPEQSKNIIIYAGKAHIENYIEFLKNYIGAIKTFSYENKNNSCVKTRYNLDDPPILKKETENEAKNDIYDDMYDPDGPPLKMKHGYDDDMYDPDGPPLKMKHGYDDDMYDPDGPPLKMKHGYDDESKSESI